MVVCRRGATLQVRAGICLRSLLPIADTALVLEESRVLLLGSFLGLSVLFQSMGRKRGRKWGVQNEDGWGWGWRMGVGSGDGE